MPSRIASKALLPKKVLSVRMETRRSGYRFVASESQGLSLEITKRTRRLALHLGKIFQRASVSVTAAKKKEKPKATSPATSPVRRCMR
jgi:hypothetical protein